MADDWSLDEVRIAELLEQTVLPVVFAGTEASPSPELVLVVGQPGAGRTRVLGMLSAETSSLHVVSGDGLRAFHPRYLDAQQSDELEAHQALADASSRWFAGCLRFARANKRSLVAEGSLANSATVVSTATRFADEGYRTRVVVVATSRAESALATVSTFLANRRDGSRAPFQSMERHHRGLEGTRALVESLEHDATVDRLTILDRSGQVVFDAHRGEASGFSSATAALTRAQNQPLSTLQSAQWMGELRRIAENVAATRPDQAVADALADLYELGLRDVIPGLDVPARSRVVAVQERRYAEALHSLRSTAVPAQPTIDPGPVIAPPGPDRGGISL